MDTLSHLALGIAVGHACAGKRSRGIAPLLYGALAAELPDFDVLLTPFTDSMGTLLHHRALSHSLLLWLIGPPLLAVLSTRIHLDKAFVLKRRLLVLSAAWLSHLVVDLFNTYGTAYLFPFCSTRFSVDALPILDITLLIGLSALALLIVVGRRRRGEAHVGLGLCAIVMVALYLTCAVCAKRTIERQLVSSTKYSNLPLYTSPLPITIARWMFVADADSAYIVGRTDPLGRRPVVVASIPKNSHLLPLASECPQLYDVQRFAKGWLSVEPCENGGLLLHDLRFSSMVTHYPDAYVLTFSMVPSDSVWVIERSKLRRHIGPWF